MIQKKLEDGVIKINGVSFYEFSREFLGLEIVNKRNSVKVPKFILFWKGLSINEIKNRYSIAYRER